MRCVETADFVAQQFEAQEPRAFGESANAGRRAAALFFPSSAVCSSPTNQDDAFLFVWLVVVLLFFLFLMLLSSCIVFVGYPADGCGIRSSPKKLKAQSRASLQDFVQFTGIPFDCSLGVGHQTRSRCGCGVQMGTAGLLLGNGSFDFYNFLVEIKLGFPLNPSAQLFAGGSLQQPSFWDGVQEEAKGRPPIRPLLSAYCGRG